MKTSYFSISKPLIKENLRRFWMISLIAFFAYFICAILPILVTNRKGVLRAQAVDTLLSNGHVLVWGISFIVPIIAAVLVYRYLHKSSAITAVHAMPFTRSKLFNSNVLSGLILSFIPIILIGLILLCIAAPTYYENDPINLFSYSAIFTWIWRQLLLVFCVYSIAVISAILTGNSIIHLLTAIWLNVIVSTLYMILSGYFSIFLKGYVLNEGDTAFYLSPFTGLTMTGGVSGFIAVIYTVFSLCLLVLASFLYHKRKLERVRVSYVFSWAKTGVCYLLAFYGTTLVALLFGMVEGTVGSLYVALIIGGIGSFIISIMIVNQAFRVFNRRFWLKLAIYAVVVIVFISSLAFDVTGFESRIPQASKIKSAEIDFSSSFAFHSQINLSMYNDESMDLMPQRTFSTRDNVPNITKFHEKALAFIEDNGLNHNYNSIIYEDVDPEEGEDPYGTILLKYTPNQGFKSAREYEVPESFIEKSPELKTIYESKEYKDFYSLKHLKLPANTKGALTSIFADRDIALSDKDRDEILSCLEKDFRASKYEDQFFEKPAIATFRISAKVKGQDGYPEDRELNIEVKQTDRNTIQWIKSHGYDKTLVAKPSDIKQILVMPYTDEADELATNDIIPKQAKKIKDQKQITEIMSDLTMDYADGYICIIEFKNGKENSVLYYDNDPTPKFLKEMF